MSQTKAQLVGNVSSGASFSGVVTATSFIGDGSLLTGVSGSQWVTTSAGIHTLSNVGIGTTNPTTELDVFGAIHVNGIYMNSVEISSNVSIPDNNNAFVVGPIGIVPSYDVSVGNNSTLLIS